MADLVLHVLKETPNWKHRLIVGHHCLIVKALTQRCQMNNMGRFVLVEQLAGLFNVPAANISTHLYSSRRGYALQIALR